jgi:hypothetical protein
MNRLILIALLLALLSLTAPVSFAAETGLALIYTANTWGEHSPCPS